MRRPPEAQETIEPREQAAGSRTIAPCVPKRYRVLPAIFRKGRREGNCIFPDHFAGEAANFAPALAGEDEEFDDVTKGAVAGGVPNSLEFLVVRTRSRGTYRCGACIRSIGFTST
jgi:hypothetical protein